MAVNAIETPYDSRDFGEAAGLGRMIWGTKSLLVARYYHYIIGAFTTLIMLLLLPATGGWWLAGLATAVYLLYLIVRKLATRRPDQERHFYGATLQFWRAELGWLGITALMLAAPALETTAFWLLYVLVIMLAGKHCSTRRMTLILAQSAASLIGVRLYRGTALLTVLFDITVWSDIVVLVLFAFVIHYLVRNVQARDRTIAGFSTVNALAHHVDMTEAGGAREWQPLLTALRDHLQSECVAVWMIDPKTRQLRHIAGVRGDGPHPSNTAKSDHPGSLPLDSSALIVEVARSGEFRWCETPDRISVQSVCPAISAELLAPINLGTDRHRSTIGVLSVGFKAAAFHRRLVDEYRAFIENLIDQAKPMLVYARRLDELLALQRVGRQVSHSLDLNEVLDSILQAVIDTIGFEFATISLVDEDNRLIRTRRGLNVPQAWLDMSVHALDSRDIQADIVRTGRTEVINGWDERFDRHIWEQFGHNDMIRIFTPIEVGGAATDRVRIIGTLEAGFRLATQVDINPEQKRMLEAFKDQAALAIEHAQLLQRARQKADVLTGLHRVGQVIASAREPSQVLDEISHSACALLGADVVMVYRYYRNRNAIDPPAISGSIWGKSRFKLDLTEDNILTRRLRDDQPYYSADAQYDRDLMLHASSDGDKAGKPRPTFIKRQNIKSFASLPLIANGETVGLMFANYRARHQFNSDERQVHELFAQQAAMAMKNSENYELARERIIRQERDHLSRELHHTVSQSLFGIKLQAQNAMRQLAEDDPTREEFSNILDIAHVASAETGFILDELRAPITESRQLRNGLEEYTRRIKKWYNQDVLVEYDLQQPVPQWMQEYLLRFAREALNNAVRHAHCHIIIVRCEATEQYVRVSVRDDGVGFDASRVSPNKLGLISMRELASAVKGVFEIETALGQGTRVTVRTQLNGANIPND